MEVATPFGAATRGAELYQISVTNTMTCRGRCSFPGKAPLLPGNRENTTQTLGRVPMRPMKATGKAPISLTSFIYLFLLPILLLALSPLTAAQTKGTFRAAINYSAGPATVPSNTGFLLG